MSGAFEPSVMHKMFLDMSQSVNYAVIEIEYILLASRGGRPV